MKKFRLIASAALVVAVVGSALAFKVFHAADIYCANAAHTTCNTLIQKVDFNTGTGGTFDPCGDNRNKYNIANPVGNADCSNNTTKVWDASIN